MRQFPPGPWVRTRPLLRHGREGKGKVRGGGRKGEERKRVEGRVSIDPSKFRKKFIFYLFRIW